MEFSFSIPNVSDCIWEQMYRLKEKKGKLSAAAFSKQQQTEKHSNATADFSVRTKTQKNNS